ncbi:MAG: hypothetical protein D8M59_10850 [Planctomycetes bacterium]|nr:hypothetical protein [Planctomycetota bacterium]NOG54152.1 hypothetical protein [Planctomycetota bacterium]
MRDQDVEIYYESKTPFEVKRIKAAAVYCSDGRFGEPFDELMQTGLELPRYDRLAIPGGAACLAGHFSAYREEEAAVAQLKFLVEIHGLEQVVLIAHEECAFYTERLRISALQLRSRQREDMEKAVRRVKAIDSRLAVHAFFAWKSDHGYVEFEPVSRP